MYTKLTCSSLFIIGIVAFIAGQVGCFNIASNKSRVSSSRSRKTEDNYANFCSGCHGEKMEAFVDRKWKHGSTRNDLFNTIKKGYADEGMPGFDTTFTDQETGNLADYMLRAISDLKSYEFSSHAIKSDTFKSKLQTVKLDTIVSGLKVPWSIAFLPGGDLLVTERSGALYRVNSFKEKFLIEGVPNVLAEGQGGLLDVALHPNFPENHLVYVSYSLPKKTDSITLATTAVMRAKLEGNRMVDTQNIFVALPFSRTRHHYGSRLLFGNDGKLYITVGERGNEKENPQSLSNFLGKIHRINDDGSIPADNPFVGIPGAIQSIYSFGHRNAQGLVTNPYTGEVWSHEHGPRGGDELNFIRKGKNYGWPVITYGINYNGVPFTKLTAKEGMEQPEIYWIPSIAPSGMAFITGDRYRKWKGDLLIGSLRFKYLDLCKIKNNKIVSQEMLLKNIGRLRDVRMGPDGYIYISVESPGFVFRLMPVNK